MAFEPGTPGDDGAPGGSGRYLIRGLDAAAADRLVTTLALRAESTTARGTGLERPRIGLLRPWSASMDEGWTRWLLQQYGFDFTNLRPNDFRAGALRDRLDVIVLADYGSRQIIDGPTAGSMPARYTGSSDFAIEHLGLPVRNVVGDLGRGDFFTSGSVLEVTTDPAHPVMSGMPERANVFFTSSPVFTVEDGFRGAALAKYQAAGTPLVSGYLLGEEHLQGYAAALDVRHGDGHVILIGFQPQWRGQPFGTFRVLFNAALFSGNVAEEAPTDTDFWQAPRPEGSGGGGR